jgi:hypothetical protein
MTEPAAVGTPAPPPGPGVVPPFAAPPVEGRTSRIWVGLGVGGAIGLVCCGGGVAALIAFGFASQEAFDEQARVVVGDYLDAVRDREYGRAYGMLCEQEQDAESRAAFERRIAAEPPISSYQVGSLTFGASDITVPVDLTYAQGGSDTVRIVLVQDSGTGRFEVCGEAE